MANAPKGTILLIDEAYIHLSDAPRSLDFVKEGKDVIVLRTFSKLYGMAGIRMGFAIGRPDLLKKFGALGGHELAAHHRGGRGQGQPARQGPGATRKKIIGDIRAETLAWLKTRAMPARRRRATASCSTSRRPGKEVLAAMAAKEIFIGRIWPAWPTQVRITVGTRDEMMAFRKAFTEVMASNTAGLVPAPLPRRLAEHPFTHLS